MARRKSDSPQKAAMREMMQGISKRRMISVSKAETMLMPSCGT